MSENIKLTLFQARYVQYLTLIGCSMRATAGNFFARYNYDLTQKNEYSEYRGFGGNQIEGILLREKAIKVLEDNKIKPFFDVNGNNIGYENNSYTNWHKQIKINTNHE